jgi:streptogramin lyase
MITLSFYHISNLHQIGPRTHLLAHLPNILAKENTTTGALSEFPLPMHDSPPLGITNGPGGNLWFTEDKGNQIGRITSSQ